MYNLKEVLYARALDKIEEAKFESPDLGGATFTKSKSKGADWNKIYSDMKKGQTSDVGGYIKVKKTGGSSGGKTSTGEVYYNGKKVASFTSDMKGFWVKEPNRKVTTVQSFADVRKMFAKL
jgi:hypothetical protein